MQHHQLNPAMRVGLVSDTHGVWDPALADHLGSGGAVSAILHGGDVGSHGGHAAVLEHLRGLAPTTAVRGNVDDDAAARAELPVTALVRLAGWAILLVHILASPEAAAAIEQHQPDIVVHGHSHKFSVETVPLPGGSAGGPKRRLLVNPGSAGPARFRLGRTAALLCLPDRTSGEWPAVDRIDLAPKAPLRLPEARAGSRSVAAPVQHKGRQEGHAQQQKQPAGLQAAAGAARRRRCAGGTSGANGVHSSKRAKG
ncbi:hypothetical protein ABPG75_007806 [Micractinium tetrahymenae]